MLFVLLHDTLKIVAEATETIQYVVICDKTYLSIGMCWFRLSQITNLMNNSFTLQQYICYTTILNMFRAARCSSSGGQIVSPQPLVSSTSVTAVQYAGGERTAMLLETCWWS